VKYKIFVLFVLIVTVVTVHARCATYRYISTASLNWYVEFYGHGPTAPPTDGRFVNAVPRGWPPNAWDRNLGWPAPVPWHKLYITNNAFWIAWNNDGRSDPGAKPPPSYWYRYILYHILKGDTVSRATICMSVDDVFKGAEFRSMTIPPPAPTYPLPIPQFSGYDSLRCFEITDFYRSLPDDEYQLEIWVKDTCPDYTGLIFYFSWDEDDEPETYSITIEHHTGSGGHPISLPFYPEGYPPTATVTTIFPTATDIIFFVNGVRHTRSASTMGLYGADGDTLRRYTIWITVPTTVTYNVTGSSIWEKRYLDQKTNFPLDFSTVDGVIPWPLNNSPDDYPDNKILTSLMWSPCFPGLPTAAVPLCGYWVYPDSFLNSLPYSFDLITTPTCSRHFTSTSNEEPAVVTLEPSSYPPSDSMLAILMSPDPPLKDTSYYRALVDSMRVREMISYYHPIAPGSYFPKKNILNYKNDFRISVLCGKNIIRTAIPSSGNLSISIYDIKGRFIGRLESEFTKSGEYDISLSEILGGRNIENGVYLIRAEFNGKIATSHLVIMK